MVRKVHIGIKNRLFLFPLSVVFLEKMGENVTESVLKKVCADRSCFNSIKNKETTSPETRSKITFSSYLFFGISDAVFSGAFLRDCWAIPEQVNV